MSTQPADPKEFKVVLVEKEGNGLTKIEEKLMLAVVASVGMSTLAMFGHERAAKGFLKEHIAARDTAMRAFAEKYFPDFEFSFLAGK